jgi:multimeric flavodoxin WrbA
MMKPEEYRKTANGEWYEQVSDADAKPFHADNVRACREAVEHHARKDRPLEILAVHGSSRSSLKSAAGELSNSQLLLQGALEQFRNDAQYHVEEVGLRDYNIVPCNGCYSTTSSLCRFPCDCFPLDDMQKLYPLVLRCDCLLISTPVNQSAMSSRLKLFSDRLISLDGGFYLPPERYGPKDGKMRDRAIALSMALSEKEKLEYDGRMWGRAAAYFITSKDQNNNMKSAVKDKKPPLGYVEMVAWSLYDGYSDYGFFHADPWHCGAAANPDEEMALDKAFLNGRADYRDKADKVAKAAVELAKKLRENPPKFDGNARKKTRT